MNRIYQSFVLALIVVIVQAGCLIPKSKNVLVEIFDGKTLHNWDGDSRYWRVENGNLVGEITPSTLLKQNSFIIWRGGTVADFDLMLQYRVTGKGNSGINYRSEEVQGQPFTLRGYQADLDGENFYSGSNYEERKRTTLAARGQKVILNPVKDVNLNAYVKGNAWTKAQVTGSLGTKDSLARFINKNDWNQYRLIVKGNRLKHYINGILMSDVTDNDTINRRLVGLLGVQVHVGPPMKIEYRNIWLKKL